VTAARGGLDPVALYEYLVKARSPVFERARGLTLEQYTREFPFGLRSLRNTLVELPQAEWSYMRRLQGETQPLPPWKERPFARFYETEFAPLEGAWLEQGTETRRTLEEIDDWSRPLVYVAPGGPGEPTYRVRATTGGMAAQFVLHEVHHRAQAMAMLRHLGAPVEDLDYSYLTFAWEDLPA
jgi:uncharacterized damage-inducible protein DinB